jgi:hypothetical protein
MVFPLKPRIATFLGSAMEVDKRRSLAEKVPDPMRDIIHGKSSYPMHCADLAFHQAVECGEVRGLFQLIRDELK